MNGTISLETVRNSLLNEELRRKGSVGKFVHDELMVARDSKKNFANGKVYRRMLLIIIVRRNDTCVINVKFI